MAKSSNTKGVAFTQDAAARIVAVIKQVEAGPPGDETRSPGNGPGPQYIDAVITSSAWDGTNHWYNHAWSEVRPTATGWHTLTGGRTGTTTTDPALNTDTSDGSTTSPTISASATPVGTIVRIRVMFYWDSTLWKPRYLFPFAPPARVAKVTAIAPTSSAPPLKYTIRVGHWSGTSSSSRGTWVDDSGGTDAYAWLPQSQVPPRVNDYVSIVPAGSAYNIVSAPGNFKVWLTQSGGANGDDGTTTSAAYPTYTYNVFLDSGKTIQLGSAVGVDYHRELQIAVTAGTVGTATIIGDTVFLLTVDEYLDRTDCADS